MRDKISKKKVDALKPDPSKDVFLWDTEAKGFGVRMKPTGARSFVLSYYAPGLHQKRRRLTIGGYGPLTVEDARLQALQLLGRIARGEDPAKEQQEVRRSIREETVGALFPEYLADGEGRRSASTLAYYESLWKQYLLPTLGHLPVAKVTAMDIADLHRSLRDKHVTANRVLQLAKAFFNWLERREIHSGPNPARKVERYPEQAKERFLTVEEMGRLGEAIRRAETTGLDAAPQHRKPPSDRRRRNPGMFAAEPQPANPTAVAALRLLLLTGWREKEALTLRWDAVDFERSLATLANTKSGRSVRALSAPALEIIAAQPRMDGSPYVFPGKIPGKPLREIQRLWYAVRAAAQLEDVRLHDLRHNVASMAAGQGHSLYLIGKMLGHKDQRSTSRYAHLADDARKAMADRVGSEISAAISTSAANSEGSTQVRRLHTR